MTGDRAPSLIPSRNELARQCADLRDELDTLKKRFAEYQEAAARDRAALELDAGKSVYEVAETAYEDAYTVLDLVKDRCYEEGEHEGLLRARAALDPLIWPSDKESSPDV